MFLFFKFFIPAWILLILLVITLLSLAITVRGAYVLSKKTPRQTFIYLGIAFGIFVKCWVLFSLTESEPLNMICILFGLPFGFFAAMPVLLFTGISNSTIYLLAGFLNLIAFCGFIEFIERKIYQKRQLKV